MVEDVPTVSVAKGEADAGRGLPASASGLRRDWPGPRSGVGRAEGRDAEPLLFLLEDDDPRGDHQHQAVGLPADADVAEEAVDQRGLREDRRAELLPRLLKPLDAAEQDRAAVGDGDGR